MEDVELHFPYDGLCNEHCCQGSRCHNDAEGAGVVGVAKAAGAAGVARGVGESALGASTWPREISI